MKSCATYRCKICGHVSDERIQPCLICGNVGVIIETQLTETVKVRDAIKIRLKRTGCGKYLYEVVQGWFPNLINKNTEYGVVKVRIVDKLNDEYHETVTCLETESVIHNVHEPLSSHRRRL
jgi:hypothetical protein